METKPNGYLGERPIKLSKTPEEWAMEFINRYGQIDGEHHKTWVLDQVARILMGTPVKSVEASWENGETEIRSTVGEPSYEYLCWRKEIAADDYGYEEGIAP